MALLQGLMSGNKLPGRPFNPLPLSRRNGGARRRPIGAIFYLVKNQEIAALGNQINLAARQPQIARQNTIGFEP